MDSEGYQTMSRPIVLANGSMHVGLNGFGEVHDFFYPYVGHENHAAASGLRHKIGVWVDGQFSWLDSGDWVFSYRYHDRAMISDIVADNANLSIRLEFTDCVDSSQNAFMRNIHIINMSSHERDVRLYMHQVFVISNSRSSDTCQYLPSEDVIVHYKGLRVFWVSAEHDDGRPFDQFSVGLYGIEGKEGTFKDAEDGALQGNVVEHGRVDSVISLHETIKPLSSKRVYYWIAAGKTPREAKAIHDKIKENGVLYSLTQTATYWHNWLKQSETATKHLPDEYIRPLQDSLLVIKSHIDKNGAVIASLDTTMLNYARDAYGYCWPRDAAYALWPLLRLGYTTELLNFFAYCKRILHSEGYLGHKYQSNGALGSSWHPYVHKYGIEGPPIQTDETALVLFLLGQYYRQHPDQKFLVDHYLTLVEQMANFLVYYTDKDGLPLPSYDLWEQKYLSNTYTASLTHAALLEASEMADSYGRTDDGARWRAAAEAMKSSAHVYYNKNTKCFYKGFIDDPNGTREFDETVDASSVFGAFMYGLFELDSEEMRSSIATVKERLANSRDPHAFVRYEHDDYYRNGDSSSPSNPWPVVSLWMAQIALEHDEMTTAKATTDWVLSLMTHGPVIPEQVRPDSFEPASVAPLVWSHAELISTMLDMIQPGNK